MNVNFVALNQMGLKKIEKEREREEEEKACRSRDALVMDMVLCLTLGLLYILLVS